MKEPKAVYIPYIYLWDKNPETRAGQAIISDRCYADQDAAYTEALAMTKRLNLLEGRSDTGLRYLGSIHLSMLVELTNL